MVSITWYVRLLKGSWEVLVGPIPTWTARVLVILVPESQGVRCRHIGPRSWEDHGSLQAQRSIQHVPELVSVEFFRAHQQQPVLGGESCKAPASIAGPSQLSEYHPGLSVAGDCAGSMLCGCRT